MVYFKGLRFGLLLQLAVGPVCLFIFSSATRYGTLAALAAVLGGALVDAAEMALLAVSASLADASEEVVVPFMTRCRAFSVILGVIAEYRQHGLQSPKVRRFFDTAPRDVRAAFYDLLVRAM